MTPTQPPLSVLDLPLASQIWLRLFLPGRPSSKTRREPSHVGDGEACGLEALTFRTDGEILTHDYVGSPWGKPPHNGFDFSVNPYSPRHPTLWAAYIPVRWSVDDFSMQYPSLMQRPGYLLAHTLFKPLALPSFLR